MKKSFSIIFPILVGLIVLVQSNPNYAVEKRTHHSPQTAVIRVVIDRFEGPYAVVETAGRQMADLPKILIPAGTKEGSKIIIMAETGRPKHGSN